MDSWTSHRKGEVELGNILLSQYVHIYSYQTPTIQRRNFWTDVTLRYARVARSIEPKKEKLKEAEESFAAFDFFFMVDWLIDLYCWLIWYIYLLIYVCFV